MSIVDSFFTYNTQIGRQAAIQLPVILSSLLILILLVVVVVVIVDVVVSVASSNKNSQTGGLSASSCRPKRKQTRSFPSYFHSSPSLLLSVVSTQVPSAGLRSTDSVAFDEGLSQYSGSSGGVCCKKEHPFVH